MSKPILCVDFDGVLHSYTSGWVEAHFIPDPPVPGALAWLLEATKHFDVKIYSSRSQQDGGIRAMATWIGYWARKELGNEAPKYPANALINALYGMDAWPEKKPPAFLTIDNRAVCFDGDWSKLDPSALLAFKPWNKR